MMLTTDLSLRFDPAYEKISRRFLENPEGPCRIVLLLQHTGQGFEEPSRPRIELQGLQGRVNG